MIGLRDIAKCSALALMLVAGNAVADGSEADRVQGSIAVSYAEFDLSKPEGASALYDRLQRAAAQVCGLHTRSVALTGGSSAAEKKACYEDALSRAVAQIDAPLVQAAHAG